MLTQADINKIEKLIDEKLDEKLKFLPTKDEFFSKMDEVMGELKSMREEMVLASGRLSEQSDQIEDHESRIKTLEKSPAVS
jgi:predicted nuclease with TOPRIM domain